MTREADTPRARSEFFASAVVVVDRTDDDCVMALREYHEALESAFENYELIIVDNGVLLAEQHRIKALLPQLPCVRVVRLAQTYSRDEAVFAGLESAIGDVVVVADVRYDQATDVFGVLRKVAETDADVVQGVQVKGSKVAMYGHSIGRRLFYWYNRRVLGIKMDPSATALTGLSRRAVNILTSTTRSHRYLIHLLPHIGLPLEKYAYSPSGVRPRHTTMVDAMSGAIEMISSYSMQPIRFVTALGALAAVANLIYAVWVIVVRLVDTNVVEGWATTSLQTSLMFVVICVILAVMAEYLGRVLEESRREPGYAIAEEWESLNLISNATRRNVAR